MKLRDIKVSGFSNKDLDEVELRPFDSEWIEKLGAQGVNDYSLLGDMGPAYTGRFEGKVIFCAGIRLMWKGVGEVWSLGDRYLAKKFAIEMFEWQSELIKAEIDLKHFHRLQAHVLKKWKGACKYMERLNFEPEALLRKYGPDGSDYILYARIISWQQQPQ